MIVIVTNDSHVKADGHTGTGCKSRYRQSYLRTAMGWFWGRTLAGFLEEAAFDLSIEGCSGVRVRARAEGRRRSFGKALEVRNAVGESGATIPSD